MHECTDARRGGAISGWILVGAAAGSLVLAALTVCGCTANRAHTADSSERSIVHAVDRLSWIAGSWRMETPRTVSEETWSAPAGGTLIGFGRTIAGDRTVFHEFLMIEEREGVLSYVAMPRGQGTGVFPMIEMSGSRVVFENPAHDYPQRITYERVSRDRMRAMIEGERNGESRRAEWEFVRVR